MKMPYNRFALGFIRGVAFSAALAILTLIIVLILIKA